MKKIIFTGIALVLGYATSFAQSKTPQIVAAKFNEKFPGVTDAKWDKENAHEYEATFNWNGAKYSANFSDKGEWLETESVFAFDQLPDKVQKAFNISHATTTVKSVSKIETSKGMTKYEIEIKQGHKTAELFYTSDGVKTKE